MMRDGISERPKLGQNASTLCTYILRFIFYTPVGVLLHREAEAVVQRPSFSALEDVELVFGIRGHHAHVRQARRRGTAALHDGCC